MKLVKKFALAVLFVSVLAVPTLAGDMTTPGKSDPPPPPGSSITTTTTTSETDATAPGGATSTTTDESYQLVYDGVMAVLGLY
jgi:hypothetical protein